MKAVLFHTPVTLKVTNLQVTFDKACSVQTNQNFHIKYEYYQCIIDIFNKFQK